MRRRLETARQCAECAGRGWLHGRLIVCGWCDGTGDADAATEARAAFEADRRREEGDAATPWLHPADARPWRIIRRRERPTPMPARRKGRA